MEFHAALSQGVWLTLLYVRANTTSKGRRRGCLKATGQRGVRGQAQAGRVGGSREECWVGWTRRSAEVFKIPRRSKCSRWRVMVDKFIKGAGKGGSGAGGDVGACPQTHLSDIQRKKTHKICYVWDGRRRCLSDSFAINLSWMVKTTRGTINLSFRVTWRAMLCFCCHNSHACRAGLTP